MRRQGRAQATADHADVADGYPKAELRVVANDAHPAFVREHGGMKIPFVSLGALADELAPPALMTDR